MAGHFLIFMFMNLFLEAKGQDLAAPKLSVSPSFISETDSVTLICQTPVPVSDCYYFFGNLPAKSLPCLKSLTGRELLSMVNQRSPADVNVTCFYLKTSESPHSDKNIISVRTLAPPTLTVHPSEITETDSVTVHCQPPSSVSVSQCYFYTLSGQHRVMSGCVQTLKGFELLTVNQRLPAEVQVQCYYTVKTGGTNSPSPHSNRRSVIVQEPKPEITLQLDDDLIYISCSLPDSAENNSKCNLYFGESPQPFQKSPILREMRNKGITVCFFTVSVNNFLTNLNTVQTKDLSCDYTSESGHGALSPRSDGYNLMNFMNIIEANKDHVTTASVDSVMTTNTEMRMTTGSLRTKDVTPGSLIWKVVLLLEVCVATVGGFLFIKFIGTEQRNGSETVNRQGLQKEDVNECNTICLYTPLTLWCNCSLRDEGWGEWLCWNMDSY